MLRGSLRDESIAHSAGLGTATPQAGRTPLHEAVYSSCPFVVDVMLADPRVDVHAVDRVGGWQGLAPPFHTSFRETPHGPSAAVCHIRVSVGTPPLARGHRPCDRVEAALITDYVLAGQRLLARSIPEFPVDHAVVCSKRCNQLLECILHYTPDYNPQQVYSSS